MAPTFAGSKHYLSVDLVFHRPLTLAYYTPKPSQMDSSHQVSLSAAHCSKVGGPVLTGHLESSVVSWVENTSHPYRQHAPPWRNPGDRKLGIYSVALCPVVPQLTLGLPL